MAIVITYFVIANVDAIVVVKIKTTMTGMRMITSTSQYEAATRLFELLWRLDVNKVDEAMDALIDTYAEEWATCTDCGNTMCDCTCKKYNEDRDDDGRCRCNYSDGHCYC